MSLISILASRNHISVNKSLIKAFGLDEAVLLGELCSEYDAWESGGKLEDGMFYSSVENITENTGLSAYEQRQAIKSLENAGILSTELKGLPARKYFKICETKLLNFLQLDVKNRNSSILANSNIDIANKKDIENTNVFSTHSDEQMFLSDSPKPKRKNLYQQCVDLINDFTEDKEVRELLVDYLKVRLEQGKCFGANTFKGMLKKLRKLTESKAEVLQIIQQAIDRQYLTFYPVKTMGRKKEFESLEVGPGEIPSVDDATRERAKNHGQKF